MERLRQLSAILDSSNAMRELARDGRWDDLPELESGRSRMIEDYRVLCATRERNDDHDAEADLLERIVAINNELAELGSARKKELADTLSGSRRQRNAAFAYSTT